MLFFVDESGHDHGDAPYEVLAAVAVAEGDLWNLIQAIRSAEIEFFGVHLASVEVEFSRRKRAASAARGLSPSPSLCIAT